MNFEPFIKAMKLINEAQHLLAQGPASYYTEQFAGAYEYLMETFAPFKRGDKAILIRCPDPFPTGWEHCKHFIKPGAWATIHDVSCDKKGFLVSVYFDDESWINRDKQIIPIFGTDKHVFNFRATSLVKVE